MSTNAFVIYAKDLNDKDNGVKGLYVHWDGNEYLRNTLTKHYANDESKLDELFSEGYASDVQANEVVRRNQEPEINLNDPKFLSMVLEEYSYIEYIHVIKNGKVTMIKYSKTGIRKAVKTVFES